MIEKILNALVEEAKNFAESSLATPAGRSEYDFGYAVGRYQGYLRALEVVNAILDDDPEAERPRRHKL
jgi:hypothetical protein